LSICRGVTDQRPPAGLPFVKMHGLGNDFVILRSRGEQGCAEPGLVRRLGDRHRGIGFDQLAEITPTTTADLRLDFWNADGTQSGACGNATRCVAAREMARRGVDTLTIETASGVLTARRDAGGTVSVNMGPPRLDWQGVPLAHAADTDALPLPGRPAAVGMGNPHCITFVESVEDVDLSRDGPHLERNQLFPDGTNVEFAQVRPDGSLRVRVWERSAGVTLACGSGACAAAVAAHRRGLTGRSVQVEMDGGWLGVDWRDDGVWLSGPTAEAFEGTVFPSLAGAVP